MYMYSVYDKGELMTRSLRVSCHIQKLCYLCMERLLPHESHIVVCFTPGQSLQVRSWVIEFRFRRYLRSRSNESGFGAL